MMARLLVTWCALAAMACQGSGAELAAQELAITGGSSVDEATSPVVRIDGDNLLCAGFAVTSRAIVTAAHCARSVRSVHAGGIDHPVLATHVHPRAFDPLPGSHDIAVLVVANDLGVSPLPLGSHAPEPGDPITLLGYGEGPGGAGTLRAADNVVASVAATSITLDGAAGGNACAGDSGGPVLNEDGSVVALVTSGTGTCGPEVTSHLRCDLFRRWIASVAPDARGEDGAIVEPDSEAPIVQITAQRTNEGLPAEWDVTLTLRDDTGVTAFELWVDDSPWLRDEPDRATRVHVAAGPGAHTLRAMAMDAAGHEASATLEVRADSDGDIAPPSCDAGRRRATGALWPLLALAWLLGGAARVRGLVPRP